MEHIHLSVSILGLIGLLTLVSLLLPLAKRLNFPFTVLLAAVGIVLGLIIEIAGEHPGGWIFGDFLTGLEGLGVTSDIILFVFLPTLIFGSALEIDVRRLLDDIAPILVLAVAGLLVSLVVVGYALYGVSDIDLIGCLLLGAIVSATDPVAVVALFRDLGAPKRLAILVEGESLLNDATAIVLFYHPLGHGGQRPGCRFPERRRRLCRRLSRRGSRSGWWSDSRSAGSSGACAICRWSRSR